ncbi:IS3 family transposase [Polaribacter sp. Q13]|uniref:IS3 family transposase n=1 Tax=Polaribacter sp. Q13 TaxID=2806551 RepID=UPI00193AE860|nr:IS3 family transposase [Polaribacter sp. Q13]QVY66861.1 IS3 family transposase [Polaribacter sp. Q13]QVY66864.1 IS3 family transposase [Polaribacter sp. Q13]QVY66885.1 IS3 family transposase [Polaribacter sp. Q13]QVY66887.1 IS3 family transposase [Polaribacter sp. Q13]QVY67061.1 IS3 family transposase [Polaribacter sp. Q13]
MVKKYDNEFKVMIVELLNSGIKTKQVSEDYGLSLSMVGRWKREYKLQSGDFSKKKELSIEAQELKALKKELKNVTMERDNLKKGGEHLLQERPIRYQFILENIDIYPVEKMCKSMKLSKNAYYHWFKNKDVIFLKTPKIHLKERIKIIFKESKEIYGSCRIQKKLEREGLIYSRSYIGLLMKEMGLRSVLKRKFVITTDSNHQYLIAENMLNREFSSLKLGEKWVSDITYIRVNDDWNYLTTIIDLADRKVVGWSLSEDMTTQNTVMKAWIDARKTRNISNSLIFHSDRGVQYASNKITNICDFNLKITQSMSRKGNCWDNAVAESFFKTIKYEWLYRFKFTSYNQLYDSIEDYIYWYNTQRLHSSLGYLSPLEMEIKLRGIIKKVA